MAPIATSAEDGFGHVPGKNGHSDGNIVKTTPLKPTGVLDHYEHFDLTPVIGREFPKVDLVEWLQAPNADELLTELAYTSKETHRLTDILILTLMQSPLAASYTSASRIP